MNKQQATDLINKAEQLAATLTAFYAASVGRSMNSNEEFSILVDWFDAVEAAQAAALSIRSWPDVDAMDKIMSECEMWLDHWQTYNWKQAA